MPGNCWPLASKRVILARDQNAALNILAKVLERTLRRKETCERVSCNASGYAVTATARSRELSTRLVDEGRILCI